MNLVPIRVIEQIQKIQKKFIWNGKKPKIKHTTLINEYQDGVLFKDVDTEAKIRSLQLGWVRPLFVDDYHPWKIILIYVFKKLGGRNIFHRNLDIDLKKTTGNFTYENKFLDKLINEGKRKLTRKFSLSYRYTDDLISFNNKRFKEFISDIYPKELTISETTESTSIASYLDLLFIRDKSNNVTTKLYDKRDAFGFHIVNFPFMSSNISSAPAYDVYTSQLIHYARCCSNYSDFLSRHRALVMRLLSQSYKVNRLSNTFKKFYGRHTDPVGQYKKNVCQMFADSIS